MPNSNPGLVYGQVPAAADWNGYFGTKQDWSAILDAVIIAGGIPSPTDSSNVGRNLLNNPLFRVQQRGVGAFTGNQYTADRWLLSLSTSAASVTIAALADADRTAIGDEAATYALQSVCTGSAGAGDFVIGAAQRIENVRRLSGRTITLSFYAKANTGTPKVGIELLQNFGSGGSPSAQVTSIGAQSITLSTSWARYSATIAVPSAVGQTFGTTANTDYTQVGFWQSSGATNNARAGGIGVQSYTLSLWGVQLETSAAFTSLEKPDPCHDLLNCQRFYALGDFQIDSYSAGATGFTGSKSVFPVTMRAVPSVTPTYSTQSGCTGNSGNITVNGFIPYLSATAAGQCVLVGTYTASADL